MNKKTILITILTLGTLVFVYLNKPICPQDFRDPNERFTSFFEWEKEFRKNNPNTEISALAKARKDFYIKHKCKEATQEPHYEGIESGAMSQQLLNIIENYNL